MDELLDQARAAGIDTLYLTVDTAITSVRERDVRNGFRSLTRVGPGLAARLLAKPGWCLDMLRAGVPRMGAVAHRPEFGTGVLEQAANVSRRIDTRLSWADVDWLRQRWTGRLVLKGILGAEDAVRCARGGGRRHHRLQPWRPPARRRALDHLGAAGDRRGGGWRP